MQSRGILCLATVAAALIAGVSLGRAEGELVENPAYQHWAAYKPGTFVTYTQATKMNMPGGEGGGMAMEGKMSQKLVEITPEKAVIEVNMNMMGRSITNRNEIPAKVTKEKAEGPLVADQHKNVKITDMKTGTDTLEVSGKKLETTTQEFTATAETYSGHTKVWVSKEIPGGMAKMATEMKQPMTGTMTMTLVEYKVEK